VAVVVDQRAGIAVGQATGVEVVREPELDAADLFQPCQLLGGKVQLQRAQVVLKLLKPAGTQDRHDDAACLLRAYPGDRHLRGAGAALVGDRVDRVRDREVAGADPAVAEGGDAGVSGPLAVAAVAAGQQPAAQRRPGGHRQLQRLRHRQQLPLHAALDQAVGHLQAGEPGPAAQVGQRDRLRDDPGGRVGDADVADLAGADHIVQCPHHLFDRREGVPDVQPVQIQVVDAEPSQARPATAPGSSGGRQLLSGLERDRLGPLAERFPLFT
jgi:hypothetical protein